MKKMDLNSPIKIGILTGFFIFIFFFSTFKFFLKKSSIENGDAYGYAKRLAEELVKKQVEENKKLTYDAVVSVCV